jgi:hypothetical protein
MRRRRRLWPLVLGAAVAAGAFAVTASNSVPPSSAGAGSGTVRGYDVTLIRYIPVAANPARLQRVRFRLSAPGARIARVRVVPGGAWFACALGGGGRNANCNVRGTVTIAAATTLDVVAAR